MLDKVNSDIKNAQTIDKKFYFDNEIWEKAKESIFAKTWQFIGRESEFFGGGVNQYPLTILENYLDEPLLLLSNDDKIKCVSNICTHRGFKLVDHPRKMSKIVCGYHGRRFDMEGQFEFMPEFKEAENFPRPCDNLCELPLKSWQNFLFTNLGDLQVFDSIWDKINERLYFLPFSQMRHAAEYDESYSVASHWALYCDNYLEGFHIPFVHNALGAYLDYGAYETIVEDQIVLQIGYGDKAAPVFDLPDDHPDYGKRITAYYYWIFPNLMLNVYPWGIQFNIVKPQTKDRCKVDFIYYVNDQKIFDQMEASSLANKTEREDEFVVEAVQKGLKSRFYDHGRFSPKREKGVHRFHQLLQEYLS